ncbi:hypothetical protein A3759_29160 [Thalassolituus sp. HI0120]|nr:hypothetical protein A3759_29160 [Thalassolituus sp. HI0120]
MALVTDLTREENRMKAMASIGASIGLSFSVALVLGPWLASIGGLSTIFFITAILAIGGVFVTVFAIPNPAQLVHRDSSAVLSEVRKQLSNRQLWPLNIGIFILHALMVAIFVAIPLQLKQQGLAAEQHSWVYLPVLVVAFILMVPFIIVAEKRRKMKSVVLTGAGVIALTLFLMSMANSLWHWVVLLLLYFWGFNLMEASLPSWLSKVAPAGAKGSAMGIYASMQFLGAFVGGSLGGWILADFDREILFVGLALLMIIWAVIIWLTSPPQHLTSVRMAVRNTTSERQLKQLTALTGVSEVSLLASEGAIYLKVSAEAFDMNQASAIINSENGEQHGSQP